MEINPLANYVAKGATLLFTATSDLMPCSLVSTENKSASTTTTSFNIDTNSYSNIEATDHINDELENLTMKDRYHGGDQVHTVSGACTKIKQIACSIVRIPNQDLVLNNMLYVPQTNKKLASIRKLALDNDAFFEFHPTNFWLRIE